MKETPNDNQPSGAQDKTKAAPDTNDQDTKDQNTNDKAAPRSLVSNLLLYRPGERFNVLSGPPELPRLFERAEQADASSGQAKLDKANSDKPSSDKARGDIEADAKAVPSQDQDAEPERREEKHPEPRKP